MNKIALSFRSCFIHRLLAGGGGGGGGGSGGHGPMPTIVSNAAVYII